VTAHCDIQVTLRPYTAVLLPMMGVPPAHCTDIGIILLLRLVMIQTRSGDDEKGNQHPKGRARILLVLSGPLPRCKKKTRWMPICTIPARPARASITVVWVPRSCFGNGQVRSLECQWFRQLEQCRRRQKTIGWRRRSPAAKPAGASAAVFF
jgi:hypothetical protein